MSHFCDSENGLRNDNIKPKTSLERLNSIPYQPYLVPRRQSVKALRRENRERGVRWLESEPRSTCHFRFASLSTTVVTRIDRLDTPKSESGWENRTRALQSPGGLFHSGWLRLALRFACG